MKARIDKITITFATSRPPRKKPREGDIKVVKGVKYTRRQVIAMENGRPAGYRVQNGRPVYEWVESVP